MKKRQNLPVRSFGAEEPDPPASELAPWVARQRRVDADLISFKLERSLARQKHVEIPCAGGVYYGGRLRESLLGTKEEFLVAEPAAEPGRMIGDARRMRRITKKAWCALPPFSALPIADHYFDDTGEFAAALAEVLSRLMREMRDAGSAGHVLIADRYAPVELEELAGRKVFFFSPESSSGTIRRILEVQDTLAVPAGRLPVVLELLPEYDVRRLILVDAGPEEFAAAAEHFDPGDLTAGGYLRAADGGYWETLKDRAHLMI
jgi:hypothetical protein